MNSHRFSKSAICLAVLVATTHASAANLLANGNFDAPLGPSDGGGNSSLFGPFVLFNAPNAGIPAWSLVAGSIEAWTNYRGTGNTVLDMTGLHTAFPGAGPGVLQQTFGTAAGQSYTGSFLMGGANTPVIKELEVSIFGDAGTIYQKVFVLDTSTLPNIGDLTPMQFSFIADAANSVVRFRSLVDSTFDGPYLDSVDISPVPEAPIALLLGLGLPALLAWRRRAR